VAHLITDILILVSSINFLGITGFLDFVHSLEFQILENTLFRKLDLFPSSGELWETPTLLRPLDKGNLNQSSV
jgi:hypothetical protein